MAADGIFISVPVWPILESSQPQLSKSPILQFLVRVYITPAALIACIKDVSLVAATHNREMQNILFDCFSLWRHKRLRKKRVMSAVDTKNAQNPATVTSDKVNSNGAGFSRILTPSETAVSG